MFPVSQLVARWPRRGANRRFDDSRRCFDEARRLRRDARWHSNFAPRCSLLDAFHHLAIVGQCQSMAHLSLCGSVI